uniref:Cell division protein FtsL n=1 Tax=Candidatus Kentrum sp. MB TaxID=2138164 RepID=A0A451B9R5_9GAMM|nr:MAG: hypothetical protein BECKMB1821I_GA0114274_101260 [Candidatus Kentron sp. MB]VFK75002.1 MAG: hypothetical protein BECKMB1821H_GA0114242_101360 [Candidatus Kentron sp. MB]
MPENTDSEKNLAKYKHKLQLYRIILEKMLLAAILVIVVYIGNYYLEEHKNSLTTEKFLLESRLTALKELASTHSQLSQKLIALINPDLNKRSCSGFQHPG